MGTLAFCLLVWKIRGADILESIFSLLARKHGLEMVGDYDDVIMKHNLKP